MKAVAVFAIATMFFCSCEPDKAQPLGPHKTVEQHTQATPAPPLRDLGDPQVWFESREKPVQVRGTSVKVYVNERMSYRYGGEGCSSGATCKCAYPLPMQVSGPNDHRATLTRQSQRITCDPCTKHCPMEPGTYRTILGTLSLGEDQRYFLELEVEPEKLP